MLEAWKGLEEGLAQVRAELALVDAVGRVVKDDGLMGPDVDALRSLTEPARWHPRYYSAAIISLYGVLERFMSEVVSGAARLFAANAALLS